MEQHISKLLATSPLFAQMAEPAIAQALDAVGWRAVTYRPHDVYALAGSACMYVDIVLTGEMVAWMVAVGGVYGGSVYLLITFSITFSLLFLLVNLLLTSW